MHRPDLTGLQPVYRVHLGRAVRWIFIGVLVVIAPSVVLRLTDEPSGGDIVLSVTQAVGYAVLCGYHLHRPDAVFVLEDGLVWQRAFRRRTTALWSDVREVRPGNRWRGHSSAVLGNGRKLPLVAMPVHDARLLAEALTACR